MVVSYNLFPHSNQPQNKNLKNGGRLGSQAAKQSRHQRIIFQLPSLPHSDQDLPLPVWRHMPSPCRCSARDAYLSPPYFKQGLGCAYLPAGICNMEHTTQPVARWGLQLDSSGLVLWRQLVIHTSSIQPQSPPGSPWRT